MLELDDGRLGPPENPLDFCEQSLARRCLWVWLAPDHNIDNGSTALCLTFLPVARLSRDIIASLSPCAPIFFGLRERHHPGLAGEWRRASALGLKICSVVRVTCERAALATGDGQEGMRLEHAHLRCVALEWKLAQPDLALSCCQH